MGEGEEGVVIDLLLQRPLNDPLAESLHAHHALSHLALPDAPGKLLQDRVVVVVEGIESVGVVALLQRGLQC